MVTLAHLVDTIIIKVFSVVDFIYDYDEEYIR